MKVGFLLTTTDHLGPFIIARDIINNLPLGSHDIEVFYLKDSIKRINFGVKTTKISSFATSINFSDFDVVHSHGFLADVYVAWHLKNRAKWITTLHQKIKPNYSLDYNIITASVLEYVWLKAVSRADMVVTLTKDMESYYAPKLKSTRLRYVYNGIPDTAESIEIPHQELEQITEIKKTTKLIGISARLVYLKGIDQVVRMLAVQNNYSLLLIGDGVEKDNLVQLATSLNVLQRIIFLGYKENPRPYLALCDVYAMSSRTEGFGLCVLEAASQSIPVVCSDIPVYKELFTDEVVKFELENINSLAHAMNSAVENSRNLAQKIHQKFVASFTAKIMADHYLKLYSEL
ncbi:glycosyltransferase family 4 protein [Mucilaginibacter sp. UR6-11]|uniref:glycosyltransferase family 4 protein n=1 Tax=Mucilaginibacter sp. UR6-11 TaxID=1435644 RepID=UPI001E2C344D|nr:glycosyltransferase family 4 protein [Mucilaginibacter sp. UR6-11]MCC8423972.1 glycosyltransferase family 4 protein [Mucilaginibacter sp. UR6-11]